MLYPKQDGLNQIYITRVFFRGEFLHCDNNFWDFLGEFSFLVEIRKKIATKMKEIAKFWETTNFLFQKTVIQLRNDEKSPYLFLRIKEKV